MIYLANWKDLVVGKVVCNHQSDHISHGFIYDGFSARGYSGSLFHLNWIVFNATVFLCIWTQSELGFSSEGAAAAMMANLLKSATKWSRSPLIPDTGRRTQIFWLRSAM